MQPWPAHNGRVRGEGIYHDKIYLDHIQSSLHRQSDLALGTTILPSKLTKGELYVDKSSGFKPRPLKRSGYIISAALPWSIMTLLTSYPPIQRVTTRASSCGCMVPCLSTSEKLSTSGTFVLTLFGTELGSSSV